MLQSIKKDWEKATKWLVLRCLVDLRQCAGIIDTAQAPSIRATDVALVACIENACSLLPFWFLNANSCSKFVF